MSRRRKILVFGALLAVCFGVVVTRTFVEGRAALAEGDRASKADKFGDSIRWWRRAARWYAPGAPHVSAAYDRLAETADRAAEDRDEASELMALRAIRSSILATRSFYTPHAERLEPTNRRIAALMARTEGAVADPDATEAERVTWHYQLLARDEAPSVAWSIAMLFGLALWMGGAFFFAFRGLSREDALVAKNAAIAGAMVLCGLVIWLVGLYKA